MTVSEQCEKKLLAVKQEEKSGMALSGNLALSRVSKNKNFQFVFCISDMLEIKKENQRLQNIISQLRYSRD